MKNIIVTGANGFIGSACVNFFAGCGYNVYAIVKACDSNIDRIKPSNNVAILVSDLYDFTSVKKTIQNVHIDTVYHFAWAGVSDSAKFDWKLQLKNVEMSCNVVTFCIENAVNTFVFASSLWEYECHSVMLQSSNVAISSMYSSAKVAAGYMCRTLCNANDVSYRAGIITNTYGEGELSSRLISSTIRKILEEEATAFTSATQLYDFIHIEDLVKAFHVIGEKGVDNKSYYLGSLNPRPLRLFLEELRDIINPNVALGIGKIEKPGIHLDFTQFAVNELLEDTGFQPNISFQDGIRRYVNWIREIEHAN